MTSSIEILTFGCRLNSYESEVIRKHAQDAQLENAIIINTCAVTKEAERQAFQLIRKLTRSKPNTSIIVTGCAAQINKESFSDLPGVNLVLGNLEKLDPSVFQKFKEQNKFQNFQKTQVGDIFKTTISQTPLVSTYPGIARAFVEIQNGCNHRCTFCTIPYGRGNSRSVPLGEIVHQVHHLVEKGYQEIVLTGVDITSYGHDLPGTPSLGQALRRLFTLSPKLPRLRLSSLDPFAIDDDLYQLFADEPRLMPHAHLSVQSGDTLILKRMKRRHIRKDILTTCARLRSARNTITFGADFIAGFPTETEEMFANTVRLVEECDLTYLHVFPYSIRPNTPASRMPQVPPPLIKERAKRLRELGMVRHKQYLESQQGYTQNILVESKNRGRTEGYASVQIKEDSAPFGSIVQATLGKLVHGKLYLQGDVSSSPIFPHIPPLNIRNPQEFSNGT